MQSRFNPLTEHSALRVHKLLSAASVLDANVVPIRLVSTINRKISICMTGADVLCLSAGARSHGHQPMNKARRRVKGAMNYRLFQRYGMHFTQDKSSVNPGPECAVCCSVSSQT